jgi:hypothetical protein
MIKAPELPPLDARAASRGRPQEAESLEETCPRIRYYAARSWRMRAPRNGHRSPFELALLIRTSDSERQAREQRSCSPGYVAHLYGILGRLRLAPCAAWPADPTGRPCAAVRGSHRCPA